MLTFGAGGGVVIGGGVDVLEASSVEGGCGSCGACDVMHLMEKFLRFLLVVNWVVVVRGVTVVVAMKSEETAIV